MTYQCKRCKSIVEATARRTITDRIAFWVSAACGYGAAFYLSNVYDSNLMEIAAIILCALSIYFLLILIAPGINRIALLRNPK